MTNKSNTTEILLKLLSSALFCVEVRMDVDSIDVAALFKEAKAQTVAAIAFDALPEELADRDDAAYVAWQNYSLKVVHNNITQLLSNAAVEKIFKDAGIPICTIKGFACASYYPEPNLRQMGDIDFLIPKAQMAQGKQLLIDSGFTCIDEEEHHGFHIAFKKGQYTYEMHESVTTFLDKDGYIEKYLETVLDTAETASLGMADLCVPEPFMHGLIMLLHMQRHMISGGGVGLRHLCDWAVFANAFENEKWERIFTERLKKAKLWEFARALSKTANIFLHMPAKAWFADFDEGTAKRLLNDMILAGNFGYKDINRYQELAFVSRDVNHKGSWSGALNAYVYKIYAWTPFFKKNKWLLPVGMLVYPIRTGLLILFKKKDVSVAESYRSGHRRNNLYNDLFRK